MHVLHHANEAPILGLGIIGELKHHGYQMSAGTLYPMLHGLERKGFLISKSERAGRTARRIYEITPAGRTALSAANVKVKELFGELFEDAK